MRPRSHHEPRWAAAMVPDGTPMATATTRAHSMSMSVGSARSQRARLTGRSRK